MFSRLSRLFAVIVQKSDLQINHIKSFESKSTGSKVLTHSVEVKFEIAKSKWLNSELKKNLREMYPFFITAGGDFFVRSSKTNIPEENEADAINKLQNMINKASEPRNTRQIQLKIESEEKKKQKPEKVSKRKETKSLKEEELEIEKRLNSKNND